MGGFRITSTVTVALTNSKHKEPAAERKDPELQNGGRENETTERKETEVKPYLG
ncbi:hypothetical protein A2U01_0018499 [Trifolium medium]|uniref:Uncharacterized protein n=1 Tax=Trifolium medium TaxID=97028 RepID=A0A392NG42_9FABA|nr:hypothetical protein [Trifolium medium]